MDLDGLTQEDRRSWHLNAASIAHACGDWPRARRILVRNLDRMDREHRVAPAYVAKIRSLMEQGPEVMKERFLALTDEGQMLRSIHPWAGLLPNAERLEILRATKRMVEDESR